VSFQIKRILKGTQSAKKRTLLLERNGIKDEETIDYSVGIYDQDELVATGSLFQNIIKCLAISEEYKGGKVLNILVSNLLEEIYRREYPSSYVYTKAELVTSFNQLGFKMIADVEGKLAFMEKSVNGFEFFLTELSTQKQRGNNIAGIVINANPFTNGHLHLIETAASENDFVHVFVLSEDLSEFPAIIRKALVITGIKHLPNVSVHDTKDYLVSTKTFPAYFLKEEEDAIMMQTQIDATIFLKIAESLNINRRYVGQEPLSKTTAIYNEAMAKVFAGKIELCVLQRISKDEEVISASRVRNLLSQDRIAEIKNIVPKTTYDFICSPKGEAIKIEIQKRKD